MATFTSVPQTNSSQFKHYDPTLLKRTKSKAKAKDTGHTLRRDHTEEAYDNLGLLHQDTEGDLHAVPQQTLQSQAMGPVKEMDSAICDLLGAGHGKSIYDIASGDRHYQFGCELLDEGGMGYATRVATSDSATNGLLDRSNFHLIDTVEEHDSAAHDQPSNKASDHQENNHDLTAGNERDHVSQRGDPDAVIEHASSAHIDTVQEGSPTEDRPFFGTIGVTNGLSAPRERSRHSSVVAATTITPAAATDIILVPEPEDAHPAKRQRLAERQAQSPMLEPASTPKSPSLATLSGQASRSIPSPRAAGRKDDGATNLVLPPSDLRDEEDEPNAHAQGIIDELLQLKSFVSSLKGMEDEQDIVDKIGESFEDKLSHNKEGFSMGRDWAPKRKRGLSNTALRPLYYNKEPMRAQQQLTPSHPRQKPMSGRPRIDRGLRSCSPQSSSPGTTADDGTNNNYRPSLDMSCEITDLTLCAIPNGSSIVAATIRCRNSIRSLDPVALGHKFFGKQGKVIRMTQLSPDSWVLLGYQCNDSALGLCNRGSLNAGWMSSSHSDAASHGTDHSDDDWDEKSKNGDQGTEVYSRRTHKPRLESDEVLLLSLKDKQGMGWKEVCKRFPGRSPGAVKLRYYMLHKKDQ
ncbi:hypothetical protein EJ07DRAFT_172502 [Lizonia empirigonia]|nr:hypothetical protein EJ07DRAFT_172502 [Lizonia empirigonia]